MKKALLILAAVCLVRAAAALDYPTRNINIIVPYSAGGSTDLATRAIVDTIPPGTLPPNVMFTVTDMPGGSGLVGINHLVNNVAHDGYTIAAASGDFIYSSVRGVTPLAPDAIKPIIFTQVDPYLILIKTGQPYTNLKELVAYIKANPGKVKFGDSGPNAVTRLVGVALQRALDLKLDFIGYDSSNESILAVINGEAQLTSTHSTAAAGQLRAGEIIPIAVSSKERTPLFPDVPTIAETFPAEAGEVNILSTMCVVVPKGMDPRITDYLQKVFIASVNTPAYKEKIKNFQAQDISHWTVQDIDNLFPSLAKYYGALSK
ncbi:MAG: tripartite tricarboxylate transporter substrate binding protein [Planctomycetota bacterium]|nr:tripartite tricarboxylate transporter substrate binding protein [Planctomycetota bacterium]